jgi:hypothetical protein
MPMIKKRTVFVLGAGAHVPYGFSTGEGLLVRARSLGIEQMVEATEGQVPRQDLVPLRQALTDNFLPSIDALLEHRQSLRRPGKMLMLSLLVDEERQALGNQWKADEDWMSLVFQYMAEDAASLEQFSKNPVTFITFNYDRLLEYRLIRGLVARYDVPAEEAWAAISNFGFFHMYGSLGQLPEQIARSTRPLSITAVGIPFAAPQTSDTTFRGLALQDAENVIQIVHDKGNTSAVSQAHQELHTTATQQIFFFGFAFGKVNIDRLQTTQIPPSVPIYCTTYKMTSAEVTDCVTPAFPNHSYWSPNGNLVQSKILNATTVTKADKTIKEFLRERVAVFR